MKSLYIHWPYCAAKCPYCDFNVHLSQAPIDEALWTQALLADLERQLDGADLEPLQTLYFGGGTPSLLSAQAIDRLVASTLALWHPSERLQVTLEVHPTSADQAKFRDFAAAGINRVSIGVQSFDEAALCFLGRDHSAAEALAAVQEARRVFPALNLDLMTALPGRDLDYQSQQIDQAVALGVDHLSIYQLGVEAGTAFGAAVARGDWQPVRPDAAADLYTAACAKISAHGFEQYEVSNFAKPGFESRHSLLGWQGEGYVGIGPGAEGRVLLNDGTWRARRTRRSPAGYLKQIQAGNSGVGDDVVVPKTERHLEQLIFGLRLNVGLPAGAEAWQATRPERIQALVDNGDLEQTQGHCRATAPGRLRLDAISDYLLNYER